MRSWSSAVSWESDVGLPLVGRPRAQRGCGVHGPATRAGPTFTEQCAWTPSSFGPNSGREPNPKNYGVHRIGLRVVRAPPMTTVPKRFVPPYATQGVKHTTAAEAAQGPDATKPYFRGSPLLPMPLEEKIDDVKEHRAGLHPSFRHHNHSPGFEVLPNGDALLVIYTSDRECEPEVSLIAARLRFEAEQWDMPIFVHSPL